MKHFSKEAEPFGAGDREGIYVLPRLESYDGYGCLIAFSTVDGNRDDAARAHDHFREYSEEGAEMALLAPVYASDAYASADPGFAIKALHEFIMVCCEQHDLYWSF